MAVESFEPILSVRAIARFAGSLIILVLNPGAYAPGFMLASAPRTETRSLRQVPMIKSRRILIFALLVFALGGNQLAPLAANTERLASPNLAAPQTKPLKLPLVSPRIIVKKAQRKLLLYSGNKLVRTY